MRLKHHIFMIIALMAIKLNFGLNTDIDLSKIYKDVEVKLNEKSRLEMINGSTSCRRSRRSLKK